MTKNREYFERMVSQNKDLFDKFKIVHDQYGLDEEAHQEELNTIGEKVLIVIKDWENKLCLQSEKAGYGNYTTNLSEKFQSEVKKAFPLIDHIGIVVKKFSIKKITLNK